MYHVACAIELGGCATLGCSMRGRRLPAEERDHLTLGPERLAEIQAQVLGAAQAAEQRRLNNPRPAIRPTVEVQGGLTSSPSRLDDLMVPGCFTLLALCGLGLAKLGTTAGPANDAIPVLGLTVAGLCALIALALFLSQARKDEY